MANNWKQIYNSSFVCAQLAASLSFTGNQSHGKQNKQQKKKPLQAIGNGSLYLKHKCLKDFYVLSCDLKGLGYPGY